MSKISVRLFAVVMLAAMLLSACASITPVAPGTGGLAQSTDTAAPKVEATATAAPKMDATATQSPTKADVAAATATVAAPAPSTGDAKGFVTMSNELYSTWTRNFNPFAPTPLWPTSMGIYEPLMIYNTLKSEMTPWLATAYAWKDSGKTLELKIREGVKFSDGSPMTAKDVLFTFNLLKTPGTNGSAASIMNNEVDSVAAPDDTTFVIKFKTVNSEALYAAVAQVVVSEKAWKDVKDPVTYTNDNPIATGPFTQVTRFDAQFWQLEKNPNYWQPGKPYIQGLRFPAFPGNDQANMAMVNGEVDWGANFIPDIKTTYLDKDKANNHYWFTTTGSSVMLYVNTTMKPFDNPDVRKALSMAIDRQQIVSAAEFDYTKPADATGLSDEGYKAWKDAGNIQAGAEWVTLNVDKANAMLDKAGLKKGADGTRIAPDGKPMTYELLVVSGWTDWVSSCEMMAQNLKDIGINASVKSLEYNAWYDTVSKGQFTMSIGWSNGGATPYGFYAGQMKTTRSKPVGESAPDNWQRYTNKDADKLLDAFTAETDPAKQKEIMTQIQAIFVKEAPAIPLFPGPDWYEYSTKNFTGFPGADNPLYVGAPFNITGLMLMTNIKPK